MERIFTRYKQYIAFFFLINLFFLAGCGTKSASTIAQPDNFHQVSERVYRSGQPTPGEMKWLEAKGIKTIINLREYHSDKSDVEGTQLKTFQVKMNAGRIKNEDIIAVLSEIAGSSQPVLVHCWHGSDRTGVVIAMYRLVFENWTKEAAIAELRKKEYGYHETYFPNIVQYLEQVDVSMIKQEVFNKNK